MRKTLIHTAVVLGLGSPMTAFAVDCTTLPNWSSESAYPGGSQIQHLNIAYQSNWWNQGKDPVQYADPYEAWSSLGACDSQGGNQPPSVSLTSPLNQAQFGTNEVITLAANASDSDGQIVDVTFQIDGGVVGVDETAPYEISWTTLTGSHTVTAIATDNQGASQSQSVSITVTADGNNQPPSVSLTYPTASTQLSEGDTVTMMADASDQDGTVTSVEFYVDDLLVGTANAAPFDTAWSATAGTHIFQSKAIDDAGAVTWSSALTLAVAGSDAGGGCAGVPVYQAGTAYQAGDQVQNANQKYRCDVAGWCSSDSAWAYEPGTGLYWTDAWTDQGVCAVVPTVNFTAPADHAVVLSGDTVTLAVDATDADGSVTQVEFFAAGQSLGTDTAAPYTTSWTAAGAGDVSLSAVATDNEGNTGQAGVLVSVSEQPLVVTLTSPTSGTTVGLGKSVSVSADAASLNSTVSQVAFLVNGAVMATDTTAPYRVDWTPGAVGNYTVFAQVTDATGLSANSSAATVKVLAQSVKRHQLIGYWHNFVNGAGCPINLSEMSDAWDVIDIAFAENDRSSNGTVHFNLYSGDIHSACPALDPQKFKQDMAALQAQGKKFVLSLGGAEGTITLNTDTDEANFVSSLTSIVQEWGFDGLDIDLESGSNLVHGSQIQARLPRALKQIEVNMGGDMYLTMAPEHPYVQGGMVAYSGIWGAYIPLIDQLRDTLDLLHVQLYNNGGLPNPYTTGAAPEGSVDMMVAQSKMLIEGFTLANGQQFAPLRDDQVAIGLPSGPSSANSGQAPTQNILDALDCLTQGTHCGSVVPAFNYPNYGGVMTWSINWDKHDGYNFSGPVGAKLDAMNAQ
ncbi:Ig-like domain-containing protein [Photobacterium sp. 1_MG-2023]|uniref:Ig-like domain-containing protein n=1 Tax=Photobacterium sp. 1_MG-2023 TaxID=3062646 RepID=UPI0026E2D1AF|nr:Ig-like domain-containing protein [Photobacterium sp. 1_MG-2023]MDO6707031.1 Ig-like domain-containing protein [Photobacterium sp. 1_MG-2023]